MFTVPHSPAVWHPHTPSESQKLLFLLVSFKLECART